jgi:hypothetical protein
LDLPPSLLETRFLERLAADSTRRAFESMVLKSYTPTGIAYPSTKYTYDGLLAAVRDMAVQGIASDGRTFRFYTASRFDYGGANLALFLAMAMTESIAYDTCDEFNTDAVAGRFAISNSWYDMQAVYIIFTSSHALRIPLIVLVITHTLKRAARSLVPR